MKHCFLALAALVLLFASASFAQTTADDAPATKADVERYFQLVKSHDLMKKLMATLSQSQRQLMHEQYLKHKDELPEDYESQMETLMANLWAKDAGG
jgi:Spy/CpxP family protein refolding chaperone